MASVACLRWVAGACVLVAAAGCSEDGGQAGPTGADTSKVVTSTGDSARESSAASPPTDAVTSTTATPAPSTSTTIPVDLLADGSRVIETRRVATGGVLAGAFPRSLLPWDDGFLATGFYLGQDWWRDIEENPPDDGFSVEAVASPEVTDRTILFSTDGDDWVPFELQPPEDMAFVERVAVFDGRLVVAGNGERAYPPATVEDLMVAVTDDGETWSTVTIPLPDVARELPSTVAYQMYAGSLDVDAEGWTLEVTGALDVVLEELVSGNPPMEQVYITSYGDFGVDVVFESEWGGRQAGERRYSWAEVGLSTEQWQLFDRQFTPTLWSAEWGAELEQVPAEQRAAPFHPTPDDTPDPAQWSLLMVRLADGAVVALAGESSTVAYRVDESGTEWVELDLPGLPRYPGPGVGPGAAPGVSFILTEDYDQPGDVNDRDAPRPDHVLFALVDEERWVIDSFGPGRGTINAAVNGDTLLVVVHEDWYRYDLSE